MHAHHGFFLDVLVRLVLTVEKVGGKKIMARTIDVMRLSPDMGHSP
jgi:hypothetical protein